ncbi:MAG: protein kinase [Bdellovibrionaceae bacterium]|nr:protein kinase [Pseudobdellovibrionaceae bacterium]
MANNYERFGKYVLLEKLASGGMAEVYLSKHTGAIGVSKFVAIKRILPQYSDNEEFIEMFKEEAKIAVNLNHSNVVHIHEFGVERNQFFLVMEYVEGRNLRQIINELKKLANSFQIDQVIYIIKEVAAGLDHAHRCLDGTTGKPLNITHRDMSPQNIMISFEGEVKIIDFGIAKAENQLESTKAGTLKGKFGYMSPEQADGQVIDLRTDVFSLGIVFWELLAKDRLFSGTSEAAILRKIRESNIPSLRKIDPAIHPDLEKIVNKALAKDKNLRYQTAAALHRDLNRFLNTHYPEFSSQDFSVFIKHTFADSFSEQKGKLVEFSNIQVPDDGLDSKTVTKLNEKYRITLNSDSEENKSSNNNVSSMNLSSNSPFGVEPGKLEIPELSKKVDSNFSFKSLDEENSLINQTMGAKTSSTKTGHTKTFSNKSKTSNFNNTSYTKKKSVKKSSDKLTPTLLFLLILVFIFSGGYIYFKKTSNITFFEPNFIADKKSCLGQKENQKCIDKCKAGEKSVCLAMNKVIKDKIPSPKSFVTVKEIPAKEDTTQITELGSQSLKYSIYIESEPTQAEVYIDGVKQPGFTPMKVEVPAKTEFQLTLVKEPKDKYNQITKKVIATSKDFKIKEVLTEKKFGYLLINSPNAGLQYEVKINDSTSNNYTLRKFIQVPAETKLIVTVTNSLGFKARQEVFVKENTRQTIELIMKKVD